MSEAFDVVVVGAGPGGIAAAATAAEAGRRVCLLDNNPTAGGQIWRGLRAETAPHSPHGGLFLEWTARMKASGCEAWTSSQVVDAPAPGLLRLEREGASRDLRYGQLILATGARERFLPFPGWTLPGVMGAGGAQALVKAGLDPRGRRVVVSGTGPLLLAVAAGLARAGASLQGIFEQAPLARVARFGMDALRAQPGKLLEGAGLRWDARTAPYRFSSWVTSAEGGGCLERVTVLEAGKERIVECDWLACGFGLEPNLELPRLLGCRTRAGFVEVDALQATSVAGVACVGELTAVGGLEKAILEGEIAGWAAAGRGAEARDLARRLRRHQNFARQLERAFALRPELRALPAAETTVCRCEDVAHGDLARCASWREAKLHTRCGMGACQGRVCGPAAEFLYGWPQPGVRPPLYPAKISTLAAP